MNDSERQSLIDAIGKLDWCYMRDEYGGLHRGTKLVSRSEVVELIYKIAGNKAPSGQNEQHAQFEKWVLKTRKHTQPFGLTKRARDGYLDLYTELQWQGWQAAQEVSE